MADYTRFAGTDGTPGGYAITVGTSYPASGQGFDYNCTVAGNATVTFLDGSTRTIAIPVGYGYIPYPITLIATWTGTGTFFMLK